MLHWKQCGTEIENLNDDMKYQLKIMKALSDESEVFTDIKSLQRFMCDLICKFEKYSEVVDSIFTTIYLKSDSPFHNSFPAE